MKWLTSWLWSPRAVGYPAREGVRLVDYGHKLTLLSIGAKVMGDAAQREMEGKWKITITLSGCIVPLAKLKNGCILNLKSKETSGYFARISLSDATINGVPVKRARLAG